MKIYNAVVLSAMLMSTGVQSADTILARQQLLNDQLKSCFEKLYSDDAGLMYTEIKMLFEHGADPNTPLYDGEPMLLTLISTGPISYRKIIDLFLQHPYTNVNKGDALNYTPLMAASIYSPALLEKLLNRRDLTIDTYCSLDERTAIDFAIERKQMKSVELLLKGGALIDHHNSLGLTPFLRAYKLMQREPLSEERCQIWIMLKLHKINEQIELFQKTKL